MPVVFLRLLLLATSAAVAIAAGAEKPVPNAQFGNVRYRTPDATAWTSRDLPDRRVFAAKVPPPDFCTLTVYAGGTLEGDFAAAFGRAIDARLKETESRRIERDTGVQVGQAAEGFPVFQRTLVAEAPQFHTYHWFLAGNSGGRFDLIAFEASSEEMFTRYGQAAADFFYSVKLANSLQVQTPPIVVARTTTPAAAPTAQVNATTQNFGPLKVGDHLEVSWAGGWTPGVVTHAAGLMYFVHFGAETDQGKNDDFFALNLIRPPGNPQTYAQLFHGTAPDPDGGAVDLGSEFEIEYFGWKRVRVARKLGDRYVVFGDTPGRVQEWWATLDQLRRVGTTAPVATTKPVQRRATAANDIRIGDLVEAKPRLGSWGPLTVVAREGNSYFVKVGPDSGLSMRGWVDLSHLRPVGAKDPFAPEDLSFFVGHWRLNGDSFQNMIDRKVSGGKVTETYQNNSGAGRNAGLVTINADGTYELSNTAVFHDGKGRWERNPNQDEGGILLRGADGKGDADCLVTNHQDGFGYLQGAIRGPGKWCTRLP